MSTHEQKKLSTASRRAPFQPWKTRTAAATGAALGAAVIAITGTAAAPAFAAPSDQQAADADAAWEEQVFRGNVDVVRSDDAAQDTLDGVVFDDLNQNSTQDEGEPGVEGVTVSNGRETTTTDAEGRYELPAYENMTVFVTQPSGYQVPVDEDNVAQFHYHHLPEGSPELDYGGIEPTGPLPDQVNFPLTQDAGAASSAQSCVLGADVQTYNTEEVEYARAGVFADLATRNDYSSCGALFLGDVVGDDLSLYPDIRDLTSMLNGPARFLPGNHDLDFDHHEGEHEFDSYRAALGPEYYSYDVGDTHVVMLSNIQYPTEDGGYAYSLDEDQMAWLREDIAQVPEDKLIVLASHAPLIEFYYSDSHRMADLNEIYDLVSGHEVVAVSGHTHMSENLREGDLVDGWSELVGEEGLPFTHLTVSAVSGQWYEGRLTDEGYPTSIQRDGTPPGVLTLDIDGNEVTERFSRTGDDGSDQMAVGLNTPAYRDWFNENQDNVGEAQELEAPNVVAQDELGETWLTTNFWMGSTGSTVEVSIDGGEDLQTARTQPMNGEEVRVGAEWSDPVANLETLVHGGAMADRTSHLWRSTLPEDLEPGAHTAKVTATDVHGQVSTETYQFQVADENGNVPGAEGDIEIEADIPGLPGSGDPGDEDHGSLVLSIDEGTVEMDEQRNAGDRFRTYGTLPSVNVTDTRIHGDGWAVSGQSSDLTSDAATIEASRLGWKPHVEASSNGATPGSAVDSQMSGGQGLAAPQSLGLADAETRMGTTELSADIELEVPVDTMAGTYEGALAVSLFPVD